MAAIWRACSAAECTSRAKASSAWRRPCETLTEYRGADNRQKHVDRNMKNARITSISTLNEPNSRADKMFLRITDSFVPDFHCSVKAEFRFASQNGNTAERRIEIRLCDFLAYWKDRCDGSRRSACCRKKILFFQRMINASRDRGGVRTFILVRMSANIARRARFADFPDWRRKRTSPDANLHRNRCRFFLMVARLRDRSCDFAGAVEHRGQHSFANIRNIRPESSWRFTRGAKSPERIFAARILQVIHGAAVCQRSDERRQFQRRHLNAFAKTRHARHTPALWRFRRHRAGLLFRTPVPCEFAESQHVARNRETVSNPMRLPSDSKKMLLECAIASVKFM